MRKRILILTVCIIAIVLLAVGCSQSQQSEEVGVKVSNWSTGLGAVGDNMDKTKLTYSIDLTNKNTKDMQILYVTLNIGDKIKDKVLDGDTTISLEKILKKDEVTQIKGEIILDTKGMDKTQITSLEPFITGVKVISEETIDINYK